MIDKICKFLTDRIRKEMPEVDDEKAEVINYGLQNLIGEVPKIFIMLFVAWILGIFKLTLFTFVALMLYRGFSGGVHLNTHLGCIIFTTLFYCGIPFIAKYVVLNRIFKYIVTGFVWVFGMFMIKLYAPADTEAVPILAKKDRKLKKIMSYVTFSLGLIVAMIIKNDIISNILLFGNFAQTILITRVVYNLVGVKYGYEVYEDNLTQSV